MSKILSHKKTYTAAFLNSWMYSKFGVSFPLLAMIACNNNGCIKGRKL